MEMEDLKSPLPPRKVFGSEEPVAEAAPVTTTAATTPVMPVTTKLPVSRGISKKWIVGGIVGVIVIVMAGIIIGKMSKKTGDKTVTLNYWGLWEEEGVVNGVIADFEAKNPGIKVKYIKNQKDNYRTRLKAKLTKTSSDSDSPDIFRIHSSWVPMFEEDLAKVPTETVKTIGLESDFWEVYKTDLRKKGSWLTVPLMYDGLSLYYNKEMLGKKGINPPKTWWGLQEAAVKLTERNESGQLIKSGVALGLTDNVDHWSDIIGLMLKQNGVNVLKGDTINQKKLEDVLAYYVLLGSKYKVWDASWPPSTVAFANGNLAFYFGPSWRIFDLEAINPNLKYEITTVPQLATLENAEMDKIEREGLTYYLTNIHWSSYWAEGVNGRSQKQKEAWKFMEYLASKESMERMYTAASQLRSFGEIYPRKSLGEKLKDNTKLKPYVAAADNASGWYLASRTFDDGGINELMMGYFGDAINGLIKQSDNNEKIMTTLEKGIEQVATKYSLVNN